MADIVRLGIEDISWIRELMLESWMKVYPPIVSTGATGVREIFEEWMTESVVRKEMADGLEFYSVDDAGEHVCIFAIDDLGDGIMLVGKLYARAGFERRGYGSKAMEYILGRAREGGFSRLRLFANAGNVNAIAFYENLGFIRVSCEHRVAGNNAEWDELTMEKVL